ncbi:MAG: hypothetical protein B6D37_03630 [Sphingobacteriales bacterium UTBCD1]|jgi:hypothetical protein|nr:MAG: hypothetical protein B6D37_03630 [Sphingobacteriales bacterium UTBCD1]
MKKNKFIFFWLILPLLSQFRDQHVRNNDLAEYEVRFTHTGYTLIYGTLADCQIRSNGKVVLSGLLKGDESGELEDPVLYVGKLHLEIDMDICSAKRLGNGEDKLCSMRVIGNGPVNVELELSDSSTNQDSYIKINYDSTLGRFQKSVNGDCDHTQMVEEENMVPDKTIATIFNGRELPMITTRSLGRLVIGRRYIERDGGNETVVEVLRKLK